MAIGRAALSTRCVDNPAWEREALRRQTDKGEWSMIANGWRTADSDMHVMEPPDLWQRYIDPAFLDAAPVGLDEIRRDMRVLVKDHVLSISTRERVRTPWSTGIGWRPHQDDAYSHAEQRGWDAPSQLEAMDAEGLDAAVLFPSRGLFVLGLDTVEEAGANGYEPELAAAVAPRVQRLAARLL